MDLGPPGALLAGLLLVACQAPATQSSLPIVRVEQDDTRIERSCRVEIAAHPIADPAGDGVIQIVAAGITVDLAGAELCGAAEDAAPNSRSGVGIRIAAQDVTLRGARVRGYRVGIQAVEADGLVLEDCDVSENFRQHLRSTKEQEDGEDWVDPHHNDQHQWFTSYGAGIFVERSRGITLHGCRAHAGQNGLVLERCEKARVYDNDFSFLSGWGIALWRSCDNVLSRNACDFCVRGYSHGVYNRGQDSAGILLFEQCSRNVIAENSATHCGDGFFCFAGQEALGGVPPPSADFDYTRRGCNDNLIRGNDFSYAAAHGLELTFGFGNQILSNRLVGNSICGIWGGYSRETRILDNTLEENGSAGYGLERGGINIEHGQRNLIQSNRFRANLCGVHLWWDEDPDLAQLPWCAANGSAARENTIAVNSFDGDEIALQLRATEQTCVWANALQRVKTELDVTPGSEPEARAPALFHVGPLDDLPGSTRPVGARSALAGRDKIVIDEWGPLEPRSH